MLAPSSTPAHFLTGDARAILPRFPNNSINCCVTSPPYFGLRDYGIADQIGLEPTPQAYVDQLVAVFREVRRVLRPDGTLWLNLGDSYAGSGKGGNPSHSEHIKQKTNAGSLTVRARIQDCDGLAQKQLIGIPWRVAFALQADGWYLRQDIIWHKPNPMPESVRDRCTKAHEYIFMFSKSAKYFYDADAIEEPVVADEETQRKKNKTRNEQRGKGDQNGTYHARGIAAPFNNWKPTRNRRSVWTVTTKPYKEVHFATFPPKLIEPCILAGCPVNGLVLDPFGGAGTTALVSRKHDRRSVSIELNPAYVELAKRRLEMEQNRVSLVTPDPNRSTDHDQRQGA